MGVSAVIREKIRAFHGSPYSFDRFSTDQIGTGEGAQAYGRGLYFAEREATAESYRDSLTKRDFEYESYLVDENRKAMENDDYLRAEMLERAMMHDKPADFRDLAKDTDYDEDYRQAAADMADEIAGFRKEDGSSVNFGSMYEVEIDASPDELLDYDLPLKEQSPQVQKAIDDLMVLNGVESYSPEGTKVYLNTGVTGDSRGHEILQHFTGTRGQEGAPETLKFAGIKGVKYADAQTRFGKGPKTRNFVVFDDKLITIMRQYGVPLAVAAQMVATEEAQAGLRDPRTIARALEQGYDLNNPLYHASKQDIDEFVPGYDDGLIFLTPDQDFANNWLGKGRFQERQGGTGAIEGVKAEIRQLRKEADEIMESLPDDQASQYYREVFDPKRSQLLREEREADSAIYPVVTRAKKPFVPSKDFGVLEELFGEERFNAPFGSGFPTYKDALKDGNYLMYENKEVVDFLKTKGYDSMFLKESSGADEPFTTLAVFDPSDIRSVNAEFDPNKTDSRNILASPIATTLGAGYLGAQASPRTGRTPAEPGAAKEFGAGLLSAGMDYIDGMRATVPYDPYGAMQGTQLYDDVQSGMTTEQSLPREQQATSTYSNPFLRGILEEEYMQDRQKAGRARSAGNFAGNTALLFSPL